jgi:hypothetical protein
MKYSHIELALIAISMHKSGGKFIQALGELISVAEDADKNKIIETFPEHFEEHFNKIK